LTKKHDPGKWGPAVAGTVEENESYESNIIKEASEELGLINIKMEKGPKIKNNGIHHYFTQWFVTAIDKPLDYFKVQKIEVMEIKWFDKSQLERETKEHPEQFLKSVSECLKLF
jgi:isopentenyldiphosphate isomerase